MSQQSMKSTDNSGPPGGIASHMSDAAPLRSVRDVARRLAQKRGERIVSLLDGLRIRGIMQGSTIPRRHDYARSEAVSTSAMKDFIAAKTEGWHEA